MNDIIRRRKLRLGLIYGMVAGMAFSAFAWGIDAWLLERAHASYYFVKLVPGLIICILAGGLVSWLTILKGKHGIAVLLWGLLALLYSWLVVWIPFTATPNIISKLNPAVAQWFDYGPISGMGQFRLMSLLIIGLVSIITGLLEINLIVQATLSPYLSGLVTALVICIILFSLAGSATDHMINSPLREPVQVINTLLQFAKDNVGVDVPPETARKMHMSAVNQLGQLILKPRQLTLIGYDEDLVVVNVLVDFTGTQAKCTAIFAQPTDCIILTQNP